MKQIVYLFSLLIFLMACDSPIIEKVEETYPGNEPKKVSYYQEVDGKEVQVEEKHFHQNGELKMSGKFVNGKRDGEWNAYFENKQIQSSGTFKEGKRTGTAKIYFSNGQLMYEGFYENNKEVGHWNFYNEQGRLVKEKDY